MANQNNPTSKTSGKMTAIKKEADVNDLVYGRVQPQATLLEEAVLGAVMVDVDAMSAVIEKLKPDSFYNNQHKIIYEAMELLFSNQQPIDLLTVHEALKKSKNLDKAGGVGYLVELSNKVASAANIEYHAMIIQQKFIQRELIRVSTQTIKDSFEDTKDVIELLDEVERNLYDITDGNMNTGYEAVGPLAVKVSKEIEEVSKKGDDLTGVTTGFKELDKLTNGWQPSDLVIIAARPGMGKTAFTLSLAKNAAEHGRGVAVFSLEMANHQLVQRLISMESGINTKKLRSGKLDELEWEKLHSAVNKLTELPIYIDDTAAINIFELRAKCRRLRQNHDVELIVIDYLQLMSSAPNQSRGNREQEISSISRALKGLAKELNVPVIALSQLSRAVETRGGSKRPILSDLRESGAIEQDADIVTFIYRPSYYETDTDFESPRDLAEIIISKHRNGSLDTVELRFIADQVKFTEPDVTNFDDFTPSFDDPMGGIITRPSRMNDDSTIEDSDDTPF